MFEQEKKKIMKEDIDKADLPRKDDKSQKGEHLEGYPHYPKSEDIYNKYEEEEEIDPNDTSKEKFYAGNNADRQQELDKIVGKDNLRTKAQGLDVPGPYSNEEEDEDSTEIEDEENQFFSLGGDRHEDLEEDNTNLGDDI